MRVDEALSFSIDDFAVEPGRPVPRGSVCSIRPDFDMRLGLAWPSSPAILESGWIRRTGRLGNYPTVLAPTRILGPDDTLRRRGVVAWAPFVLEAGAWRRIYLRRDGRRVTLALNEEAGTLVVDCAAPLSLVYRAEKEERP